MLTEWPKLLWVCEHCGHWHGASYNSWPQAEPPRCKVKGYGRDGKSACGRVMRPVTVIDLDDLITRGDILKRIWMSSGGFENWRKRTSGFPQPLLRLGTVNLYSWSAIERWLWDNKRCHKCGCKMREPARLCGFCEVE